MVPMPASSKAATSVNDFLVLSVTIPPAPSFPRTTTHYLYIRANAPRVPTEDTPREIFLVNVPIDATELHIRSLFADQLGGARVESVAFEGTRVGKGITAPVAPARGKKRKLGNDDQSSGQCTDEVAQAVGQLPEIWDRELHRSGSTAVVTFVDKASADSALQQVKRAVKKGSEMVWGRGVEDKMAPLGSVRYLAHHKLRYVDSALLQASVDEYMTAFAAQEAARTKLLARQRAEPDEDGFITVTRGGRNGPAREEAVKLKAEELKKREQSMIKNDFYRFQTRERKKEEAKSLVRDFEQDHPQPSYHDGLTTELRSPQAPTSLTACPLTPLDCSATLLRQDHIADTLLWPA
nr:ribosomal rna-processing protein 7 [Quercus suber]